MAFGSITIQECVTPPQCQLSRMDGLLDLEERSKDRMEMIVLPFAGSSSRWVGEELSSAVLIGSSRIFVSRTR
ncbi:hypothetical protein TNCV_2563201 [Trichonephila clavipes]|uniref:Uncharacterized protein n=1 Tax=Trichonephila clavipes TaxID=2585209 RepID=A0A8X6UNV9_TRICX|nr:hypothetical protein TNCV_2563201 [Trichonephila clavipes]